MDADWLAGHIGEDDLVVLHMAPPDEPDLRQYYPHGFEDGHIPGARPIPTPWFDGSRMGSEDALYLEMPAAAYLDSLFESLGIGDTSRVVVYGSDSQTQVARLLLTLEYAGLEGRVTYLDGGWEAWIEADRPTSTEPSAWSRGTLTTRLQPDLLTERNWIQAHLDDDEVMIVDSRTPENYTGEQATYYDRAGHIPGAVNISYRDVLQEDGRLKDAESLRELFDGVGYRPGQTLVTYCHIGQQASLVRLAARTLGYTVKHYDGSFHDWSRQGFPTEIGGG